MTHSDASHELRAIKGLVAERPDPLLGEKLLQIFPFLGKAEYDFDWYLADGSVSHQKGQVHAAWILDGTAIQAVWNMEVESLASGAAAKSFGTDIYSYHLPTGKWQILWVGRTGEVWVGRSSGLTAENEVIFTGNEPDGSARYRWIRSGIDSDSFQWRKFVSDDGEKTWVLFCSVIVRRAASQA